jgi:predicted nucleic acid-binding protein
MGRVIDSSILIAAERGLLNLEDKLATDADEPIVIAAITASELLHGVHRAAKAAQRSRRQALVEHYLSWLSVIPFDLAIARIHADIWAKTAAKGTTIGAHDLLIGATALSLGFDIATRNVRDFSRIPGLNVIQW